MIAVHPNVAVRYTRGMPDPHTPDVGEIAPDFALPDSTGASRSLAELAAADTRLVLIFFRGHW